MPAITYIAPVKGESLENFLDLRGEGVATSLINFIPNETSIELRKGFTKYYDLDEVKAINILSYEAKKAIIVVATDNKLYAIRNNMLSSIEYSKELGEVTSSIQTNDRLIIFFINREPLVIFYNESNNSWATEELELNNLGVFLTGAIKYKERLFFYTTGSNTIYYLDPLSYKGDTKSYELSNRFGARGNLVFLGTIGFNAGASVQSLMYAVFDSGDILTFNGTNPDDLDNWAVVQKVETGALIKYSATAFTDSLLLANDGIYSLTEILKNNSITGGSEITAKIKNRLQDLASSSPLELCFINGFLYILNTTNDSHLGINLNTGAIFEFQGMLINNFCVFNNQLIFVDNNGEIFTAFSGNSDNGKAIIGVWESSPYSLPDGSMFRTTNSLIDCYIEGQYNITFHQRINDQISFLKRSDINVDNGEIRWAELEGKSWEWVESHLWSYYGTVKRKIYKISAGSNSRRYAFRLEVSSSLHTNFNVNRVVINCM
ncbi:hypothetical protein ACFX5K_01345 [Rickettsiales bacterium LUAb2]